MIGRFPFHSYPLKLRGFFILTGWGKVVSSGGDVICLFPFQFYLPASLGDKMRLTGNQCPTTMLNQAQIAVFGIFPLR